MATAKRTRQRLTREERRRQLLDVAWRLVHDEGTEALTLGRLAELAEVTKPVVYDHFVTRNGLLSALYREWDERQAGLMDAKLERTPAELEARAEVIAASYVDCVMSMGPEMSAVMAALAGAPELEQVKRAWEALFFKKVRKALARTLPEAGMFAMLGAAEALSYAAARGDIKASQAKRELQETIISLAARRER